MVYYGTLDKDAERFSKFRYLAGLSYSKLGNYEKALTLLQAAYVYAEQSRDTASLFEYGTGLAAALHGTGRSDTALRLYTYLLNISNFVPNTDPYFYATAYAGMAGIQYANGQHTDALQLAEKALKFTENQFGYFHPKLDAGKILYLVQKEQGLFGPALKSLENYIHLRDSLMDSENNSRLSVLQAAHDFEKKEEVLRTEERRKRQITLIFGLVFALLAFTGWIFYRSLSKQKRKTETLLENILPRETIAELKEHGRALARIHPNVSILFCDVKAFTTVAETLSPENLVQLLDFYFREFDAIIAGYGLEKIKTIGDAYMVAGGLHDKPDSAFLAVKAALEILDFNERSRSRLEAEYGTSFHFRIGIHTGSVISGVVGRDKYAYDIWGDAVNIAARMEQNSEPGMINVSGTTRERIGDRANFKHRGKINAKNKGEIDMYFVERS
jgi:adenylate cyclase